MSAKLELATSAAACKLNPPPRRWPTARLLRALPLAAALAGGTVALCIFQSPQRHYQRALAAVDESRLELVAYELLCLKDAESFEAQTGLLSGMLLLARGEPKAAMQEAAVAADNPETKIRSLVLLGECLYESGQFMEAGDAWTKAIEQDPKNVDALRWLGVAYYELGAVREALVHLRAAAELRPHDPGPHRLIARLCSEVGDARNTAIEAYEEALRRAPDRPDNNEVRFALAKLLYRANRYRDSRQLLSQCDRTADVIALTAECEHVLGNTERAWSLFDDALRLDAEHVRSLGLKGKLLVERGEFDEAARTLETAARLAPKDTAILYDLGIAYQRVGETKRSEELHRYIDRLHVLQQNYEDLMLEAVDDPRDAAIRYRLGTLAAELGDTYRARMWLQASVRLDSANVDAQAALQSLGLEAE